MQAPRPEDPYRRTMALTSEVEKCFTAWPHISKALSLGRLHTSKLLTHEAFVGELKHPDLCSLRTIFPRNLPLTCIVWYTVTLPGAAEYPVAPAR